jgi:hypothetical protein
MNRGTVELLTKAVTSAGQTLAFTQSMSAVLLQNIGPNTAYFADGTTAPTASVGNGRYGLQMGEILALVGVNVQNLSFKCATGQTASVQAIGMPSGVLDGQAAAAVATPETYLEVVMDLMGVEPLTAGDDLTMGPIAILVPLAPYSDVVFDDSQVAPTNAVLALSQADTDNTGYVKATIQVILDDPLNTVVDLFDLILTVAGTGGGTAGAGVGIDSRINRLAGMTELKAVAGATNVVAVQCRAQLIISAGTGVATGAISMVDKSLKFEANAAGSVQP